MNAIVKNTSPAEAAREAIRRLAAARMAPTPENFARAYREAAGESGVSTQPAQVLGKIGEAMLQRRPDAAAAQRFAESIKQDAWQAAFDLVDETIAAALAEPGAEWPRLLQRLLAQLEAVTPEWTRARKLGAVEHVLKSASGDAARTREKLDRLISAWAQGPGEGSPTAVPTLVDTARASTLPPAARRSETALQVSIVPTTANPWREIAMIAIGGLAPQERRQDSTPTALDRFGPLLARLQALNGAPDEFVIAELRTACLKYQNDLLREAAIRERLKALLRLVCDNLNLFADDDAWVRGQMTRIGTLLDAPLDEQVLSQAEEGLRAAILRQSELKDDLVKAKAALKEMLASLIERLSAVAKSTGEYYLRIDESAGQIRNANDLASLSKVVANLLDDTGTMRDGMQRTHSELNAARDKATAFEQRVQALEQELVEVSNLVRTDPLTQLMNRRGLDDAFDIEQARAERDASCLSVALLDIDNFKRLNDSLGHQVGDMALRHLSDLVRNSLRPTDTVARFGGEEFIILLPSTSSEQAVAVITRLQRLLTRALFLHNDEKILITFSAGITRHSNGETRETVIARADKALYAAKTAGKNRVVVA